MIIPLSSVMVEGEVWGAAAGGAALPSREFWSSRGYPRQPPGLPWQLRASSGGGAATLPAGAGQRGPGWQGEGIPTAVLLGQQAPACPWEPTCHPAGLPGAQPGQRVCRSMEATRGGGFVFSVHVRSGSLLLRWGREPSSYWTSDQNPSLAWNVLVNSSHRAACSEKKPQLVPGL